MSYTAGLALDCVSLIESAIDARQNGWLQKSAAITELWDASLLVLEMIENNVGVHRSGFAEPPDASTRQGWKDRFAKVLDRLHDAGIATTPDAGSGVEHYVRLRAEWDNRIHRLGESMLYRPEEVDPACSSRGSSGHPTPLPAPVRSGN